MKDSSGFILSDMVRPWRTMSSRRTIVIVITTAAVIAASIVIAAIIVTIAMVTITVVLFLILGAAIRRMVVVASAMVLYVQKPKQNATINRHHSFNPLSNLTIWDLSSESLIFDEGSPKIDINPSSMKNSWRFHTHIIYSWRWRWLPEIRIFLRANVDATPFL